MYPFYSHVNDFDQIQVSARHFSGARGAARKPLRLFSSLNLGRRCGSTSPRFFGLDALEALTNATVGLLVSWGVTYLLLPLWGLTPTIGASLGITAMYFCISALRSFVVRRIFRGIANG